VKATRSTVKGREGKARASKVDKAAADAPRQSRQQGGRGKRSAATPSPRVVVRWEQLEGTPLEVEQAARDVAETVTGEMQRRLDAPRLAGPAPPRLRAEGRLAGTAQSAEPLTYYLDDERVVGWQWAEKEGSIQLITESGRLIDGETAVRGRKRGKLGGMERQPTWEKPQQQRSPMRVQVRPGRGGRRRADRFQRIVDPTEGLSAYGELIPQAATGGASLYLIELDPSGNSVIPCRLSSEEEQEQFLLQLEPSLALAKRFPEELRVRYALFAMNMSGTRTVRPDRAGPPPAGELERDDMLIIDRWIQEGWLEHIIARGGDRIAREMLPAETLLERWSRNGIGLWLARHGRKMDYRADRLALRAEMMVSAEERAWATGRLQAAQMDKGPFAGNGWLGTAPFGFIYDRKTRSRYQDWEQWPFILRAFELADCGDCLDGNGLSTRMVADRLAEEGCPFDHDRVRKILGDILYATGEYVTVVRGVPLPQKPIPLENPVPLDRFLRVQDLLVLRQGRSDRTPLGEFVFNYVPFRHKRCAGTRVKKGTEVLIKGYIANHQGREDIRRYRHSPKVPDSCKSGGHGMNGSFTWERADLERPVIERVRELAEHPEVLRQLALAERHGLAESPTRLSEEQRAQIEHDIAQIEQQREVAAESWVAAQGEEMAPSLEDYQRLMMGFRRRIEGLQRQLERDAEAAAIEHNANGGRRQGRVGTFLEIMTVETPDDLRMKALRARLFQRIVSEMELEEAEDGTVLITLRGHLVPAGTSVDACDPIAASADLLDAYAQEKAGGTPEPERVLEKVERVRVGTERDRAGTDLDKRAYKSVSAHYADFFGMPSNSMLERVERQSLGHVGWRQCSTRSRSVGEPAWVVQLSISTSRMFAAHARGRALADLEPDQRDRLLNLTEHYYETQGALPPSWRAVSSYAKELGVVFPTAAARGISLSAIHDGVRGRVEMRARKTGVLTDRAELAAQEERDLSEEPCLSKEELVQLLAGAHRGMRNRWVQREAVVAAFMEFVRLFGETQRLTQRLYNEHRKEYDWPANLAYQRHGRFPELVAEARRLLEG
jgi:hypothetical protein